MIDHNLFVFLSERSVRISSNRLVKDAYTSNTTDGLAPQAAVEYLENEDATAHRHDIERSQNLSVDLNELKRSQIQQDGRSESSWFMNPVHRPCTDLVPYSDLVMVKPLTAAVLQATTHGTLARAYTGDISNTKINDFDMQIFQETDVNLYKSQLRHEENPQSPYQLALSRLKREKLKLEEAYLLKLKCQAELEDMRGPKPKWYEMKTKGFNRELRKNNNLLEGSGDCNQWIEYRNQLVQATGRWENLKQ